VVLTDNRHARPDSIMAVVLAWLTLGLSVLVWSDWLLVSCVLMITLCLYLCVRSPFLVYGILPAGVSKVLVAIPLSFILDIVRGCSVIIGTVFAGIEWITNGNWKPFIHTKKEIAQ
jgi:hypothetical protein